MELEKRYRVRPNLPVRFSSSISNIFGTWGAQTNCYYFNSMPILLLFLAQ